MLNFSGPSYPTVRFSVYIILIWDPSIFNLYNLWQTWFNHICGKPHQRALLHFNEQITRTNLFWDRLLKIRPAPAQVIQASSSSSYSLWKGPSKLCIECHLVPLRVFPPKLPGWIRPFKGQARCITSDRVKLLLSYNPTIPPMTSSMNTVLDFSWKDTKQFLI